MKNRVASAMVAILVVIGGVVAAAERPNVIVIFTDDHGYSDLSCQGIQDDIRTPNIDRLATSGVRMTSGYVSLRNVFLSAPGC